MRPVPPLLGSGVLSDLPEVGVPSCGAVDGLGMEVCNGDGFFRGMSKDAFPVMFGTAAWSGGVSEMRPGGDDLTCLRFPTGVSGSHRALHRQYGQVLYAVLFSPNSRPYRTGGFQTTSPMDRNL